MQNFRLCAASVITALLVGCGVTCAFAIPLTPFRYESQAQRHCPADVIVWLDLRKGIYYSKRQRWYGRGFTGSFVCQEEARAGGYRRSLLGLTIVPAPTAIVEDRVPSPVTVTDVAVKKREREAFALMQPSNAKRLEPSAPGRRELKPQRQRKIVKRHEMPRSLFVARQPQFGWFGNTIW